MDQRRSLQRLPDHRLLEELSSLVRKGNQVTAELLAYIGEVDRRRLYLEEACASLHAFCIERLNLSEGAAAKRIRAARAARTYPVILEMIAGGDIHVAGVHVLAPHLTRENHRDLLARARHKTKREIEKLVAEVAPKPDVPSRIRKIPAPSAPLEPDAPSEPAAPEVGTASGTGASQERPLELSAEPPARAPAARTDARPGRPARLAPLSGQSYSLTITLDEEAHADLQKLRDLMSHQVPSRDPAEIVKRAVALLLERTLARKAAVTDRPRKGKQSETPGRRPPAWIRRAVWERDGGQCTYRDAKGRRCSCRKGLEYHHIENWAVTGEHRVEVITLRCRPHNQFQAELDYGKAFMEAKRRAGSGAREGAAL